MEQVVFSLVLPTIGAKFDVVANPAMQVGEITALLRKIVVEVSENRYVPSGNEILCSLSDQRILRDEDTFEKYCVQNGDQLMFL